MRKCLNPVGRNGHVYFSFKHTVNRDMATMVSDMNGNGVSNMGL